MERNRPVIFHVRCAADQSRRGLHRGLGRRHLYANVFTKPELENPEVSSISIRATAINLAIRVRAERENACAHLNDRSDWHLWFYAADSFREGTGELDAYRIDSKFDFDGESWFKSVLFGVRYAEREQNNKEIGLNWGGISPAWAGGAGMFSQMNS